MIIGVAGLNGSGKGEVVEFLRERSFFVHSLSDEIRDVLENEGRKETRERMIETGTALRAAHGPGVLATRLARSLQPDRNYAIDSIRHPAEVDVLRQRTDEFSLVWIEASEATRLKRICERGRPGDPTSVPELRAMEERELESAEPAAQQLRQVERMADHRVSNEGSLEDLHSSIQLILQGALYFERPGWDEYFMSIARMVASRSNCVKRKVGTVVTTDRRIVSTGYNGTPRGTRNCNEGGCPRCNSFAQAGTRLDECLCSHAEENAITQASYHGVSLRGGTLYTTFSPCLQCSKMIINAGLAEVVYSAQYSLGETALELFREAGIKQRKLVE